MTREIRVSYVVLSYNSSRVLERCIRSLLKQAVAGASDEVWIVDNGSTDGSVEMVREFQQKNPEVVNAIYLDANRGTTVSRNLALRRASGRFVAVVDSDVFVPPGTVDRLIADLEQHDDAGLVVPQLRFPDGRLQLSVDRFPTVFHKIKRLFALRDMERHLQESGPQAQSIHAVDYAIAAFWLLRRQVLDEVGLLDERIFYAPEDVDYCIRVWKAGYSVLMDPAVHAVHDAQEISRGFPFRRASLSHIKGLLYLFRKHRYILTARPLGRAIERVRLRQASSPRISESDSA